MMKRILLLCMTIGLLMACSSAYDEAITKAHDALEKTDFTEARKQFNVALEEDDASEEAQDMLHLLDDYDNLQEEVENKNWEEADHQANELLEQETIVPVIEKEVEQTIVIINEEVEQQLTSQLEKVEKQLDEEDIDKATKTLDKLEKDPFKDRVQSEIDDMREELVVEEKRIAEEREQEEKRIAEEKEQEEKEKREAAKKELHDTYYAKADGISAKVGQPEDQLGLEVEWDALLNEVYAALENNLPEEEFSALASEQRAWLDEIESEFSELAHIGTVAARDSGTVIMAEQKEERIYYLINEYLTP